MGDSTSFLDIEAIEREIDSVFDSKNNLDKIQQIQRWVDFLNDYKILLQAYVNFKQKYPEPPHFSING